MGITESFAKFIVNAKYEDLPDAAVAAAKRGLLDFVAVTLAADGEAVSEKIRDYARQFCGAAEATVINGGYKTSAEFAALANGTMSHALDYDDVIHVTPAWLGHPSVAIFPAVLAVAEKNGCSGRELILAYCVAIEIYVKTGLYCGNAPYDSGWHNTSYIGSMAAAAAVCKLLHLDEVRTRNAFGIAASLACGVRQNFGTMTKPLHAGLAARNGVEAATLAQAGFTANEFIYEAPLGFRNVFTARKNDPSQGIPYGDEIVSEDELVNRLGNPWNIALPGASTKLCPSCRATHFGMEAALQYRQETSSAGEDLAEIECHVPDHIGNVLIYHDPAEGLEGKFSLEYVLAKTILDGIPGIYDFTDEKVNDPRVKALIKKIKCIPFVPEQGTFGLPEFIFRSKDGTEYRTAVEFPRGEPQNPVTDEIIAGKYEDCAGVVLDVTTRDAVRKMILGLEQVADVNQFTMLLGNFQ